jgi:hypothetical protein
LNDPENFTAPSDTNKTTSCWFVAGVGCLIAFILGAALFGFGLYRFGHSKAGGQLMNGAHVAIDQETKLRDCEPKMKAIHDALGRYQLKVGDYPKTLASLVPDYLTSPSILHCETDPVKDPSHVSFVYSRPTPTTQPSAVILSVSNQYTLTLMGESNTVKQVCNETLGGTMTITQYQNGVVTNTATVPTSDL